VRLGVRTLSLLGYRAEGESNAIEALARLQRDPQHFQLVITDLTMPGLNGLELAQRVRDLRAGLPVVLASGYRDSIPTDRIQAAGVHEILSKPYTMATLALIVRRHLSSPSTN